jgi:hypothetical protein
LVYDDDVNILGGSVHTVKRNLLVYDDDVNILGGSVRAVKRNGEAFLFCSKDNGLEVPADKPKYMVMSRDQNAEVSHHIKIDNSSF